MSTGHNSEAANSKTHQRPSINPLALNFSIQSRQSPKNQEQKNLMYVPYGVFRF